MSFSKKNYKIILFDNNNKKTNFKHQPNMMNYYPLFLWNLPIISAYYFFPFLLFDNFDPMKHFQVSLMLMPMRFQFGLNFFFIEKENPLSIFKY